MSDKVKAKDIIITIAVIVVFAISLVLVLNIYKSEGEKRSASISSARFPVSRSMRRNQKRVPTIMSALI